MRNNIIIQTTPRTRFCVLYRPQALSMGTFVLLLFLLVACGGDETPPMATPPATATAPIIVADTPTPSPVARVLVDLLHVRSGPDQEAPPINLAKKDDMLPIQSQFNQCQWLEVASAAGRSGWIMAEFVELNTPCNELPASTLTSATITSTDTMTASQALTQPSPSATESTITLQPSTVQTATVAPALTLTPTPASGCIVSPPANWSAYRVVAGDSLSAIAARTGTTVAMLTSINCLSNTLIHIGQILYVPGTGALANPNILQPADTLTPTPTLVSADTPTVTPTTTPAAQNKPSTSTEIHPADTGTATLAPQDIVTETPAAATPSATAVPIDTPTPTLEPADTPTPTPEPRATATPVTTAVTEEPVLSGSPTPTDTEVANAN